MRVFCITEGKGVRGKGEGLGVTTQVDGDITSVFFPSFPSLFSASLDDLNHGSVERGVE